MKRLAIASLVVLLVSGCSNNDNYAGSENEGGGYTGNPYSEGTGHYAGFEWAERTGGSCNGNSASFNEGCEEYYYQTRNQ